MRKVLEIQVGMFEGKVGFTQVLDDGTMEHKLFDVPIAEQLANMILQVCKQYRYIERQCSDIPATKTVPGFADNVGITESVNIRLSPPSTQEKNDEDKHD